MRIISVKDITPSRQDCGCSLSHESVLREVIIGSGILGDLPNLLERLDIKKPFGVFYDKTTLKIAGEKIVRLVKGIGFEVSEPTFREAERIYILSRGVGGVLAVGGGTVIDVGKYIAYKHQIPFISIPTALSHDGIVSPVVSLFYEGGRRSVITRAPIFSLIDLDIISTAPRILTASGFGDVLAKVVSIKDWQLGRDELREEYCYTAEKYTLRSIGLVVDALKSGDSENYEALAEALVYSGISMMIAGSSRPASGSEHLFSHYLDMYSPKRAPHGVQTAIGTLPTSLYHELHNPNWWKNPEYGWKKLRSYMERAGIPLSLKELEIPVEVAVKALIHSTDIRPDRYTILHKRRPTEDEAIQLLRETGLI
ncbi:MAG: iron-containing alcohol dehydrogenase [Candidatus Caldarchaeales archaeon]